VTRITKIRDVLSQTNLCQISQEYSEYWKTAYFVSVMREINDWYSLAYFVWDPTETNSHYSHS